MITYSTPSTGTHCSSGSLPGCQNHRASTDKAHCGRRGRQGCHKQLLCLGVEGKTINTVHHRLDCRLMVTKCEPLSVNR